MVDSLDRVAVTWAGTGTGTMTLGGAVSGRFFAPTSALNGKTVSYVIEHSDEEINQVEVGRGVYTHSSSALTRATVLASTNGGALVSFSAGTKIVRLTLAAADLSGYFISSLVVAAPDPGTDYGVFFDATDGLLKRSLWPTGSVGPGALVVAPGNADYTLTDASTNDVIIRYFNTLTATRTVSIDENALPASGGRLVWILNYSSTFFIEVLDEFATPIGEVIPGQGILVLATTSGSSIIELFWITQGDLAGRSTVLATHLDPSVITDQPTISAPASGDRILIADASDSSLLKGITYADLVEGITGGAGGDTYNEVDDAGDYSSVAFAVGTGGEPKNERRRFTASQAHKINFPTGLADDSYGAFKVLEAAGATITSAATITVNGVADRGGAGAALAVYGLVTWWRNDDGTIEVEGDIGAETKAFATHNHNDQFMRTACLLDYSEAISNVSSASGVLTLNLENSNVFRCVMTENITSLVLQNPHATNRFTTITLILVQDSTPRTFTFTNITWDAGGAPTISTASGANDVYMFWTRTAGSVWRGVIGAQGYS